MALEDLDLAVKPLLSASDHFDLCRDLGLFWPHLLWLSWLSGRFSFWPLWFFWVWKNLWTRNWNHWSHWSHWSHWKSAKNWKNCWTLTRHLLREVSSGHLRSCQTLMNTPRPANASYIERNLWHVWYDMSKYNIKHKIFRAFSTSLDHLLPFLTWWLIMSLYPSLIVLILSCAW